MSEKSLGMAVALGVLAGMLGAYIWSWRQVARYAKVQWGLRWLGHALGLVLGAVPAALFAVTATLILPPRIEGQAARASTVFVILTVVVFVALWQLPRRAAASRKGPRPIEHAVSTGSEAPGQANVARLQAALQTHKSEVYARLKIGLDKTAKPARDATIKRASKSVTLSAGSVATVSLPDIYRFEYSDADGVITTREVRVRSTGRAGGRRYLVGLCMKARAERTFRLDRVMGSLTQVSSGLRITPDALFKAVGESTAIDTSSTSWNAKPSASKNAKAWETAVYFAGFGSKKRDELAVLADAADWQVRVTLTKTVDYVVEGSMAGSSQMAKARELGISVIEEDTFRAMV